jgi:hypothetical protein
LYFLHSNGTRRVVWIHISISARRQSLGRPSDCALTALHRNDKAIIEADVFMSMRKAAPCFLNLDVEMLLPIHSLTRADKGPVPWSTFLKYLKKPGEATS